MIRSLLIDNYDSYTYNLFQLMAQVYEVDPVVVRNDDPRCVELAEELGCVVISPGPGDPYDPHDFGMCAEVLRRVNVPLLGVCLGHQGIGAITGAKVVRAPQARHGYISKIRHTSDEIFHGIPQDFSAVRYHSLCVAEPLPPELAPIAHSEDGLLMGVRHQSRPFWGVQFHPESVLTEYGSLLLWNFGQIVSSHHKRTGDLGSGKRRYTAHTRRITDFRANGAAVYSALFGQSEHTVWLDSVRAERGLARFSYLTEASPHLGEVLTYKVADSKVFIEEVDRSVVRCVPGSVFDVLNDEIGHRTICSPELPFDFTGGYMGYFGYELKAECGSVTPHSSALPDAVWIFADRLAVIDHANDIVHLIALSGTTSRSEATAMEWLDWAESVLLKDADHDSPAEPGQADGPDPAALRASAEAGLVRDRDQYIVDISRCKEKLLAGETYEVCLTDTVLLPRTVEPLPFYGRLRQRNPAPYSAYVSAGGVQIACSSPERFLKIDRSRVVESKPIKGTLPRGRTPEEDVELRRELASDPKSRAENLMIVDLLRNDLGRVCEPGSVHVPSLMQVESYTTVHQLVSTVRGRLRHDVTAVDCVRACFPGGSMTGAPKLRTMEIIDELETRARGPYSGTIGFLSCDGTADLNITIRTAVFTDEQMIIGAGGAIVLDSDPSAEYEEMVLKAMAPMRGLPAADATARSELYEVRKGRTEGCAHR